MPLQDGINHYLPEYRDSIIEATKACILRGKPYDLELQKLTAKGRKIWVRTIG